MPKWNKPLRKAHVVRQWDSGNHDLEDLAQRVDLLDIDTVRDYLKEEGRWTKDADSASAANVGMEESLTLDTMSEPEDLARGLSLGRREDALVEALPALLQTVEDHAMSVINYVQLACVHAGMLTWDDYYSADTTITNYEATVIPLEQRQSPNDEDLSSAIRSLSFIKEHAHTVLDDVNSLLTKLDAASTGQADQIASKDGDVPITMATANGTAADAGDGSRSHIPSKLPPPDMMRVMMVGLMPADARDSVAEYLLGARAFAGLMDGDPGDGLPNWVRRGADPSTREKMTDAELVFHVRDALTEALAFAESYAEVEGQYDAAYADRIRGVLGKLGGPVDRHSELDYFEVCYPVDRALTEVERQYLRAKLGMARLSAQQSADAQAFLTARGIDPTPMSSVEADAACAAFWFSYVSQLQDGW